MFFSLFLSKSRNSIISKSRENQTFASAADSYFFPLQLFLHKIKLKTFQTFALLSVEEEKTQIEEIKGRTPSTILGLDRA